jgi:Glycosyltransferase family 87
MFFLKKKLYWDIIILVIAGVLLYYGSSWQFVQTGVDAAIYQCYATAFWQGPAGLQQLPAGQCSFLYHKDILDGVIQSMIMYHIPHPIVLIAQNQNNTILFHTLPREYPIMSLFVFSVPLIAPAPVYQEAYALWSLMLIIVLYAIIMHFTSRKNAMFFIACTVIAGWSTAVSRFDLFPAACTLGALILANKGKWTWAYVCIAIGTLLKFYPLLLLPVFFIAEQRSNNFRWNSWKRWKALILGFVAVFVSITLFSFIINIPGTIGSMQYFTARPLQIESFPASLVWLTSYFGFSYYYLYAFVSINIVSRTSNVISIFFTALLLIGLLSIFWMQWRGKIETSIACLAVLALTLCTSKILSPQYILWIIPFVAYIRKPSWQWVIPWGAVMVLTCLSYPITYTAEYPPSKRIFAFALIRGLLLLGFVVTVLWKSLRQPIITSVTNNEDHVFDQTEEPLLR